MLATLRRVSAEVASARVAIVALSQCPLAEGMHSVTGTLVRSAVIVIIALSIGEALVLAAAVVERVEARSAQASGWVTARVPAKLLKGISNHGARRVDRNATNVGVAVVVVAQIAGGTCHVSLFTTSANQ